MAEFLLDVYMLLQSIGLAVLVWAPLYLIYHLIMTMAELDAEEKERV